jgi:cold shock protein
MKGKVKFFNHEKEFGFIIGDDGKDYFLHKSGLNEGLSIDKDDSVEFTAEKGDRGLKAIKVSKA